MKYLKIENNKGYYLNKDEYLEIDKIDKQSLLMLLNSAEADDFELDPYNESLLGNKAHQIIYENIYNKLNQFLDDRDRFGKEVDELYKEAISKYSVEIKDNDVDNDENFEHENNEDVRIEDIF